MILPQFNNEKLFRQALTHCSYINENLSIKEEDNERLEFLGDALLTFLSGEYLYDCYPEMTEGQMTRRRAALVDEKQLAKFAINIGLDLRMRLGKGVIHDGGFTNPNLLSSTFEAFIGAYYLDKNLDINLVRNFVRDLFDSVPDNIVESRSNIDSKNRFQQWIQRNVGQLAIKYITNQVGGTPHAPEFIAQVFVDGKEYGEGQGRTKKEAEKQAAENALTRLQRKNF